VSKNRRDAIFAGGCSDSSDFCRLIEDEAVVQIEESLLRDRCLVAAGSMCIGAGEVKCAKDTGQVLAIDAGIDSAACDGGVIGKICRGASDGPVELT
jgi:hypothetical protein